MAVPIADTAYGHIAKNQEYAVMNAESRDTEEIVRAYFSDIPVMVQIARCESTFRHTLKNGTVLRGKHDPADTGVMQINARYHSKEAAALGYDLTDLHGNLAYARHLYEKKGTQPWNASRPCWHRTIAMR